MLNDVLGNPDYDLSGLSDTEVQTLLGELGRLPGNQRFSAFRRMFRKKPGASSTNGTTSWAPVASDSTSRGELLRRLDLLPPEIVERVKRRELQLSDARLAVAKTVAGLTSIKLLRDFDVKATGIAMVNGGKLAKDNWMIVTGIQVLSGINATLTDTDYGVPTPTIRNGHFEFKVDKKNLLQDTHSEGFDHRRTDVEKGMMILHNPKIIEPQKDIELNFEFSGVQPANTNLKCVLIGSGVIPY